MTASADFEFSPVRGSDPLTVSLTNTSGGYEPANTTFSWKLDGTAFSQAAAPGSVQVTGAGSHTILLELHVTDPATNTTTVTSTSATVEVVAQEVESGGSTEAAGTGGSTGKWLKLKTPDYHPENDSDDVSYLRLGAIPDDDSDLEIDGQGPHLKGNDRHGWYSYTTGNRLEATDGNREVYIGGANRFSISNGGLGVFDAEPIYGLYFREEDDGAWRKTEWGRTRSDTYFYGDSESFFGGFTFSSFGGLQTSLTLAGSIGMAAGLSFDASVAGRMSFSAEWQVSASVGNEYKVVKKLDQKASDVVSLRTAEGRSGGVVAKTAIGLGTATAVVGAATMMIAGWTQAHLTGNQPDDTVKGANIGGGAIALVGLMAMAGVQTYRVISDAVTGTRTYDARMRLEGKDARIGNQTSELFVSSSGVIAIGKTDVKGTNLIVNPTANKVELSGMIDGNKGTLKVLP